MYVLRTFLYELIDESPDSGSNVRRLVLQRLDGTISCSTRVSDVDQSGRVPLVLHGTH